MNLPLYLASTSPRRRELLQQAGFAFSILPIAVDESRLSDETPENYVARMAREKAEAGVSQIAEGLVIAADTIVVSGKEVLGKPANKADAMNMWRRLSGNEHTVMTAVAVAQGEEVRFDVVKTTVKFCAIAEEEMEAYWASGEPADKAGGYAIQGKGALFVTGINGSYSNVVGLPLLETAELLSSFSWSIWPAVSSN